MSLNTKQAWAQASENGKVIYSSAGGRRAGAAAGVLPVPPRELLSCDQHMACAAPRVPLRGPGQAAHKGPGDRGWMERQGSDPKLRLPGSDPPVHLLCPHCSGVPVLAPPRHPDCRLSGSLITPLLSHHASQAASPAPKLGDAASFLSASPPRPHCGPAPQSVHLSLDSHGRLLPQQLPAFA